MTIERDTRTGRLFETDRTHGENVKNDLDRPELRMLAATDEAIRMLKETTERTRRIETRLTTFMIEHGMTPPTTKAYIGDSGRIIIPSLHISLKDIILTVRDNGPGRYTVQHAGHQIGYLDIWPEALNQATTMPLAEPPTQR